MTLRSTHTTLGSLGGFAVVLLACASGCSEADSVVTGPPNGGNDGGPSPESGADASPSDAALKQLEANTGTLWAVLVDPPLPTPAFLWPEAPTKRVLFQGVKPEDAAMAFLVQYATVLGISDPRNELDLERVTADMGFGRSVIYRQHVGPAEVRGGFLRVDFDGKGGINSIQEHFFPNLEKQNTTPTVDAKTATSAATADMLSKFPGASLHGPPSARLAIDPALASPLVWLMDVVLDSSESLMGSVLPSAVHATPLTETRSYAIDATTGAIVEARSYVQTFVNATGTGTRGDKKSFLATLNGATYYMAADDSVSRPAMSARDMGQLPYQSATADAWVSNPAGWAVDAYTNAGLAAYYWFKLNGRQSYDGNSAPLQVVLNVPSAGGTNMQGNAAWYSGSIVIGPTDGNFIVPTALDVMAHEYQHAVNQSLLGDPSDIEAQSTNEGLADIFGNFAERKFPTPYTSDPQLLGEGGQSPYVRSLAAPGYRTFTGGAITDSHIGAGLVDFAWDLITYGGTNTDNDRSVNQAPLGIDDSEQLYLQYVTTAGRYDGFVGHARNLLAAAKAKGLSPEQMSQVGCAFWATNVLPDTELKNAFNIVCDNFNPCGDPAKMLNPKGTYCGVDVGAPASGQQNVYKCKGATTTSTTCKTTCVAFTDQSDVPQANCCPMGQTCKPSAADLEGLRVTVPASPDHLGATMQLKNVTDEGTIVNWKKNHADEAGGLSKSVPPNAECFSFLDGTALGGIANFPDDIPDGMTMNNPGTSNLVAIWQDGKKKYQWSWVLSADAQKFNGNFLYRQFQFYYDGTLPQGKRSFFRVFAGIGGFTNFNVVRQPSALASVVVYTKSPYFDFPDATAQ